MAEPIEIDNPLAFYLSFMPGSTIVKLFAWYGLALGIKKGQCLAINSFELFCIICQWLAWSAVVEILVEWVVY